MKYWLVRTNVDYNGSSYCTGGGVTMLDCCIVFIIEKCKLKNNTIVKIASLSELDEVVRNTPYTGWKAANQ